MLWLALYFPRLALEVFTPEPLAIVVERECVVSMDAQAKVAGIELGMRLSSALGLAAGLHVHQRDEQLEQMAMHGLCCWAGGFTPHVCRDEPGGLLLEVGGCERLFGGFPQLLELVQRALGEQGWSMQSALAATPRAARWLALAGREGSTEICPGNLAHLHALPVGALECNTRERHLLDAIGARCLGDILRLPRAGLARRLGADFVKRLAQALGEVPDLRERFVFPLRFEQKIELPVPVVHAQALMFAGRRLIAALSGCLQATQSGVRECVLRLEHAEHAATLLVLAFAEAMRDVARMERVLREKLERLQLIAPVEYVALVAAHFETAAAQTEEMFGEASRESLPAVIERLRARLGDGAVAGLAYVAAHRPECASDWVPAPVQSVKIPHADDMASCRPRWLLPQDSALAEVQGSPWRDGPLKLLAGPERIESGWWDAGEANAMGEVRRDYFVAISPAGECLWIYRDVLGWFLHGIFA